MIGWNLKKLRDNRLVGLQLFYFTIQKISKCFKARIPKQIQIISAVLLKVTLHTTT